MGATTIEEYRKYIEKDTALARRFQVLEKQVNKSEREVKYEYDD